MFRCGIPPYSILRYLALRARAVRKSLPKSFKTPSKIVQNRHQNLPKSSLGGFWAFHARLLSYSWQFPSFKAPLAGFLDTSWAAVGWFCSRLGRLLGSWAALETSWGPFWNVLGCPGGIWPPIWWPKSIRIIDKSQKYYVSLFGVARSCHPYLPQNGEPAWFPDLRSNSVRLRRTWWSR